MTTYIRPLLATVPGLVEKLAPLKAEKRDWREVQSEVESCIGLVVVYQDAEKLQQQQVAAAENGQQDQPRPEAAQSVWIFPDSSSRLLSRAELAGLDADTLWRARNEIFARHGYVFTSAKGKAFAASLGDFYQPRETSQTRVSAAMNRIEQANVELIKAVEKSR